MTTRIGKQFEQPGLFPEHEAGIKGSPATQTPEEFRDDPDTVFHASYVKIPRDSRIMREHPGLHAGTYQSALERALSYGKPYNDLDPETRADGHEFDDPANAKIVVHPLSLRANPLPKGDEYGSTSRPTSDWDANDESVLARHKGPFAYENAAEDEGSLSVVWPRDSVPDNLHQSEWVHDAVRENARAGRPPHYGIHPRTYAMYTSGTLDNYDQHTHREITKSLHPQSSLEQHNGGLYPYQLYDREARGLDRTRSVRLASREEAAGHVQGLLDDRPDGTTIGARRLDHNSLVNAASDSQVLHQFTQDPYYDTRRSTGADAEDERGQVAMSANFVQSQIKEAGGTTTPLSLNNVHAYRTRARVADGLGDVARPRPVTR
jgi:hypothetical protein